MKNDVSRLLPLTPAALHILLALAAEDRHGYAIMQEVRRQTEGRFKLGPGTLYDNLARLMREGLVTEAGADERRRYYRLNAAGRKLLALEIARLETVIRDARASLGSAIPGRV